MNSVAKKVEGLQGAFQALVWGDGGLDNFLKILLDLGTGILKFTDDTGALNVALVVLSVTLGAKLIPKLFVLASDVGVTIVNLFRAMAIEGMTLSTALEAVGISASVTQLALGGLVAILAIGVMAYNKFNAVQKEEAQARQESVDKSIESIKSLDSALSALKNEALTREQLNEIIGSNISKYSDEISKISDLNKARQETIDKIKEQKTAEAENIISTGQTDYEKAKNTLSSSKSNFVGKVYNSTTETEDARKNLHDASGTQEQIDAFKKYKQALMDARIEAEEGSYAYKDYSNEISRVEAEISSQQSILKSSTEEVNKFNNALSLLGLVYDSTDGTVRKLTSSESQALAQNEAWTSSTENSTDVALTAEQATALEASALEVLAKSLGLSTDELEANASAMGVSNQAYADYTNGMNDFNDSIDSIQESYATVTDAMNEYNETGSYSMDTLQALLKLNPEYLASLQMVNGQLVINDGAFKNNILSQAELAKQQIYGIAMSRLQAIEAGTAGDVTEEAGDKAETSATGWNTLSLAVGRASVNAKAYAMISGGGDKGKQAEKVMSDLQAELKMVDTTVMGMGTNFAGSMGKASSSASKTKDKVDEVTSSVKSLLKEDLQDKIDKLKDSEEDEVDVLNDKLDVLEKTKNAQVDAIDAQIDTLESSKDAVSDYYDNEIAKIEATNDALDKNNKLMELQQALALAKSTQVLIMDASGQFAYGQDEGAVTTAEQNLADYQQELTSDSQIINLETEKANRLASIDSQISAMETLKTSLEANYEQQKSDLEAHIETVKSGYDVQIEQFEEFKENVDEFVESLSLADQHKLENQLNAINQEDANHKLSLANLQAYADNYKAILASMGVTVAPSKTSSSTATKSTKTVAKHAQGVSSIGQDELSLVGDAPNQELVIGSKANGTMLNMAKGSGVVNATSTKTLAGLLNGLGKFGGLSGGTNESIVNKSNSNSTNISIGNISMPNVKDANGFVNELKNFNLNMTQYAYER